MNFIVLNPWVWEEDKHLFFGEEEVIFLRQENMIDILVMCDIFKSKNDAKRNWKGPIDIPEGFNQFTVGKLKTVISVLNPTFTER